MSNRLLIIPDLHGSNFWIEPCNNINQYERIVFLGDYFDSSKHEQIGNKEMINNFINIINFKIKHKNKVILLYGNHEFAYRHISYPTSGSRIRLYFSVRKLLKKHEDLFQIAHIERRNILFTHAGISNGWFNKHANKLSQLGKTIDDQLNNAFKSKCYSIFGEISKDRGGTDEFGSPIWAHISETSEDYLNNYIQIVGHTPVSDISYINKKDSAIIYCDCHKPYILEL